MPANITRVFARADATVYHRDRQGAGVSIRAVPAVGVPRHECGGSAVYTDLAPGTQVQYPPGSEHHAEPAADLYGVTHLRYHAFEQKLLTSCARNRKPTECCNCRDGIEVLPRRPVAGHLEPETMGEQVLPSQESVALSGCPSRATAVCTGRSVDRRNDLRTIAGYDIPRISAGDVSQVLRIAHLLVHGKLPTQAELTAYKAGCAHCVGCQWPVKQALEALCRPQRIRWM